MGVGGSPNPSIDGFDWGITVVPRPQGEPLCRVRVRRHRAPERTKEITDPTELQAEIDALCRELGTRRPREEKRMEKAVDLAAINLEDVIRAKRVKLDELEEQLSEIEGQRKALSVQIRALEKAAGIESAPRRKKRHLAAVGEEVAFPTGEAPLTERIAAHVATQPKKAWKAAEIADALDEDRANVAATLSNLTKQGRLKRVDVGEYKAA